MTTSARISLPINTIGTVAGFIGTIAVIVTAWNDVNNKVNQNSQWITEHANYHKERAAEAKLLEGANAQRFATIEGKINTIPNLEYRLAQMETSLSNLTARLDKSLADINMNFNEQRKEIGSLSTQIELSRQILQRIENKIGSGRN